MFVVMHIAVGNYSYYFPRQILMKIKTQHSFTNIKVASFNCRGLNDKNKRAIVFDYFMNSDLTIICLQETKLKPEKEFVYVNEWKNGPSFFNSVPGGKSGTAILLNTRQIIVKKFLCDHLGKVIALDIDVSGTMLHVVNTYFPNDTKEQYSFISGLRPFFYSSFPLIWAGDHNISTDNMLDRHPPKSGCDKFGKEILEILNGFDLIDTARSLYPLRKDMFTWFQGNVRSRIDKIIVQDTFKVKHFIHEVNVHSDHVIIIAHLQLDREVERGLGNWKNNVTLYQNDTFKDEFSMLWDNWKSVAQTTCPVTFWISVKKKIKNFLIDIGKLTASEKRLYKNQKYEELMFIFRGGGSNLVDINNYLKEKKMLAKLEIDDIKEKMDLHRSREFMEGDRPTKCFFQKFCKKDLKPSNIKGLKDSSGDVKNGLRDMLDIAAKFYEKLFFADVINEDVLNTFLEYVQPITSNVQFIYSVLCGVFTEEELWDAIMSFLNGKSPGPDGITIEFYKAMFSVIKDDLLCVYNCMLDQEFIPTKMKDGLIVLIPKGEPSPDMGNYRGITLNNVDLKFFSKMLHFRLAPYLQESIHLSQYSVPGKKGMGIEYTY